MPVLVEVRLCSTYALHSCHPSFSKAMQAGKHHITMACVFNLQEDEYDDVEWQEEFADIGLATADVLGRIEEFIAEYIAQLTAEDACGPPPLDIVSRSRSNTRYLPHAGQAMHELLSSGRTTTQRDLYYRLQQPILFRNPREVDKAIQDVVALLRVPRASLGVNCSSRGALAGLIHVKDNAASPWQDCTATGAAGKPIPGDLSAIEAMGFQCRASWLLVVEKDAVFQRLVEDRIFDHIPCVLVTAKGMPDLATRALCAKLTSQVPNLVPLGLVDYNPHGVIILRTYKYGSHRMGLESHRFTLPNLRWLGLRGSWLADVDADHLHELQPRDKALLPGIRTSLQSAAGVKPDDSFAQSGMIEDDDGYGRDEVVVFSDNEAAVAVSADDTGSDNIGLQQQMGAWIEELGVMETTGYKADIESLYSIVGYEGFTKAIVQAILRREFL